MVFRTPCFHECLEIHQLAHLHAEFFPLFEVSGNVDVPALACVASDVEILLERHIALDSKPMVRAIPKPNIFLFMLSIYIFRMYILILYATDGEKLFFSFVVWFHKFCGRIRDADVFFGIQPEVSRFFCIPYLRVFVIHG